MSVSPTFDSDLTRRYDRRGPRYASYPPAVQFHTGFDVSDYRRAALLSNAAPGKPLAAHMHVPPLARDSQQALDYLNRLLAEIELQATLFDPRRSVEQLHLSGAVPASFTIDQLDNLIDQLVACFRLVQSEGRELSIEIDPRVAGRETFPGLAMVGFNRASFLVQDFEPAVQAAANRQQSARQVWDALLQARAAGFRSVSFDLIYGLPLQTVGSFARTLDTVVAMRPDRIAAYAYAHLPRMLQAQRASSEIQLPDAETRLRLLALTVERLTAAGYVHIGMDHFALPHDELSRALRAGGLQWNFQGYSTRAECDLIGFGVGASGSIGNSYAQNRRDLTAYGDALDHRQLPIERGLKLTVDDLARREIIQRILCSGNVARQQIEEKYALDFASYFAGELAQLQQMAADGLLSSVGDTITVSDKGRFLLRSIAMVFDAYSRTPAGAYCPGPQYSKVI